jgi:hypothetical protein
VSDLVFVVVEQSPVGETVVGVFSSLAAAQDVVPAAASGRLHEYRIEGHIVDARPDPRTAWRVVIDRGGTVQAAELADI